MLKEMAEINAKDKLNLKKSLEDISHQLRTPLTSILVMLDNLIDDNDIDLNIKRQTLNISFLVENILKLSKFDANTIKLNNEKIYLHDIIRESAKNVAPLSDLKNIKVNITGDHKIQINGDLKWQVEALTNILKNSLEYSSINSDVELTYGKNNIYAYINIKNKGQEIAKKDLKHIFERFYKGANSSSESIGIGLALAKTIIEETNGTITATSSNGETIFTIKYFY